MRVSISKIAAALAGAIIVAFPVAAGASEIKLLTTVAMASSLKELIPAFEKQSGHRITTTSGLAVAMARRVQNGDAAEVLIATRAGVDGLIKDGKIIAGSDATLARSG